MKHRQVVAALLFAFGAGAWMLTQSTDPVRTGNPQTESRLNITSLETLDPSCGE